MQKSISRIVPEFVIIGIVLFGLICGNILYIHIRDVKAKSKAKPESPTVTQVANVVQQLAKTQQAMIASVAHLEYLTKALADGDTLGDELKAADKAWQEKMDTVKRQAAVIKKQQDEIAKLKKQLGDPPKEAPVEKEATK